MRRPRGRRIVVAALLLLLAATLRVGAVQLTTYRLANDGYAYLILASQIDHVGDYSTSHDSGVGASGTRGPSAYFAPGYPYLLAVDLVGGNTGNGAVHAARLTQALLGVATVALIGLIANEVFGELIGLLALGLAAVYPPLIQLSTVLAAENLFTPLLLGSIWATLRAERSTHRRRWVAAAGVLIGLAALTHVNGVVLVLPLALAVWRVPPPLGAVTARLAPLALLLTTTALTLVPWAIRNAVELHHFIPISDETGITLVGTYNPVSAADRSVPYQWRFYATLPQDQPLAAQAPRLSEAALSGKLEAQAIGYIGKHPFSPLAVMYHNTLRLLDLEGSPAWRYSFGAVGLSPSAARVGVIGFWILGALALFGAFTRTARTAPRWLWLVPVLLWLSVVLINAETPRFREPIDPFLILLGACALARASRRSEPLWLPRGRATPGSVRRARTADR